MNKVITIGRQYGSGGREIGKKLGEALGIPVYDYELIERAAKESGFAEATFANAESRATSSLLYSISRGMTSYGNPDVGFSHLSLDDRIYLAQADVIRKVAAEGPCIIVGRCGDYILRKQPNVISIFIMADMDFRKERAVKVNHMEDTDKLEDAIRKIDKRRANYYNFHTGEKWGRAENYHLSIKSSTVGVDKTVEVIKAFVEAAE